MTFRVDSEWRSESRCFGLDPDKFFAAKGRPRKDATDPCTRCPVRDQCLDFALDSPWQPCGVWGGLTERDLVPLWRQRHPDHTTEIQRLLGL